MGKQSKPQQLEAARTVDVLQFNSESELFDAVDKIKAAKLEAANKLMSDEMPPVESKFLIVKALIGAFILDGANPHYKSKYPSLSGILSTIAGPIHDNLCTVRQTITPHTSSATLFVNTVFTDTESGTAIATTYPIAPIESKDPQKFQGAITYAKRGALVTLFQLPFEEDDDAETVVGRGKTAKKPTKVKVAAAAIVPVNSPRGRVQSLCKQLLSQGKTTKTDLKGILESKFNVSSSCELNDKQVSQFTAELISLA